MHYTISYTDPSSRFIELKLEISQIHQDVLHLQLPSWRPGRYELQNYAKNVRGFKINDADGKSVRFRKTSKDRWEVDTHGLKRIEVSYEYFANQPDAGASYLCDDYLYINPVNCLMYAEGRMDEEYTLDLKLPSDYLIATQLTSTGTHSLSARDFDYLADSPLIASASLQHHETRINKGTNTIHCWFQGKHPFDMERLISDTVQYAEQQTKLFGDLPCTHYHFLYLIHNYPFRHGVEHLDSTVIAMGQTEDNTVEEFYNDLLAISCHELFHLWNIKRIRPAGMLPYDFTSENYSTLGYVYEGVTTYYGDLMLLRSGVWEREQYEQSLCSDLKRHFENEGRFNYSVAESSWDTWLDGYVAGIPARKVSIYMEGLIAALIADVMILKNSGGKHRLDDVLKELYQHEAKQHIGYTEERYRQLLEKYAGIPFDGYFTEVIHGRGQMERWLRGALHEIGYELSLNSGDTGLKISLQQMQKPAKGQEELLNIWLKSL